MVQWIRLCASKAGDTGSIPGELGFHMLCGAAKKTKNKQKLLAIPWRSRLGLQALTAEDPGSNPGPGTRIPQAARCGPGKTY